MKDNSVFAQGICKQKYFIMFLIGSFVGSVYEDLLQGFRNLIAGNGFIFDLHRGVIYGPFNVIYGFGAVIMMYFLLRKSKRWYQVFLEGSFLGGAFEYLIGYLQETFLGTTSWDYSDLFLNINGRTSVGIMFIWGLFSLVFIEMIYPFISKQIEKIPYNFGNMLYKFLVVFMSLNILLSWSALIRQALRRSGYPAYTIVGSTLDKVYPDSFLAKYFANAKVVK